MKTHTNDGGDGEVSGVHLLSQPLDLPTSVTEDDSLGDGEGLVQVTQRVQLPLLQQRDVTNCSRIVTFNHM